MPQPDMSMPGTVQALHTEGSGTTSPAAETLATWGHWVWGEFALGIASSLPLPSLPQGLVAVHTLPGQRVQGTRAHHPKMVCWSKNFPPPASPPSPYLLVCPGDGCFFQRWAEEKEGFSHLAGGSWGPAHLSAHALTPPAVGIISSNGIQMPSADLALGGHHFSIDLFCFPPQLSTFLAYNMKELCFMSWFSSPALSLGVNGFFLIPSLSKMGISSSLLPPGHFCPVSGATVWGQAVTAEDKLCSYKLTSLNVPGNCL